MEEILAENEALRENTYDELRSRGGNAGLGPMGPLNMELLNELNERVEILMTENALMVEQKAVTAAGACHLTQEISTTPSGSISYGNGDTVEYFL